MRFREVLNTWAQERILEANEDLYKKASIHRTGLGFSPNSQDALDCDLGVLALTSDDPSQCPRQPCMICLCCSEENPKL
jgi:hypothetical protein